MPRTEEKEIMDGKMLVSTGEIYADFFFRIGRFTRADPIQSHCNTPPVGAIIETV